MKTPRQWTIRRQILAALLLTGLLAVAAVTAQSLHCAHEGLLSMQQQQLSLALAQAAADLRAWPVEHGQVLAQVALTPAVRHALKGGPATGLDRYLTDVTYTAHSLDSLYLLDREFQVVAQASTIDPGADALIARLREALPSRTGPGWWTLAPGKDGSPGTVALGCPVIEQRGAAPIGYLVAHLDMGGATYALHHGPRHPASLKFSQINDADGRYFGLRDQDVKPFGNTEAKLPPGLATTATAPNHAGHVHGAKPPGAVYRDYRGKRVLGQALALPEFGRTLVAEVDHREAFDLLYFLGRRAGYSAIALALLIGALALWVARRLSYPLMELNRVCRQVAAGEPNYRLGALPSQEAHEVAMSFNTMLDRLAETQRQLVQAGALAAVGELSASIVHEMRNPLNTIQMNLAALRRRLQDEPQYLELFELAERQTRRLQDMLNDLLQYGRPLAPTLAACDLEALLREVAAQHQPQAVAAQITLDLQLPPAPVTVTADRELLHRAFANLLENALQATPPGGTVRLTLAPGTTHWIASVEDSGPGIPEPMRERVFHPFFTTRPGGTGLGLATVRKLVQLHHGTVTVGTAALGGAAFILRCPRTTP
jgi:signal transduction histidine kinase